MGPLLDWSTSEAEKGVDSQFPSMNQTNYLRINEFTDQGYLKLQQPHPQFWLCLMWISYEHDPTTLFADLKPSAPPETLYLSNEPWEAPF